MKKLITLFLISIPFGIFAQNNLHDAKILGSITIGNKEITSVLDETTGCSHKTNLHAKNLFVVGESVKIDVETNPNQPKIVKPNLPEVVFVDKCKIDNDPFHEKRMEIIQFPLSEQRVLFSELPTAFKVGVWKDKWKQVQSLDWTTAQQEWIDGAEELIIDQLFIQDPSNELWINIQNNTKPLLEAQAITVFDDLTMAVKLINRLEDFSFDVPIKKSPDCNTSSDFCSWTCNSCSCTGCATCSSSWGCGFMWSMSCNGYCQQSNTQ